MRGGPAWEAVIMKIGILGAGNIGGSLAQLFAQAGHDIALSNSRGPDTLTDQVATLGPTVHASTAVDAAAFGDVVVEAIPFGRIEALPASQLAGKILVSASNYYPQRDGEIDLAGASQTEFVARGLPETRVVKAFNTIWYRHLRSQGDTSKPEAARRAIFLAGDDEAAKQVVAGLIRDIGFGPVDTGSLHHSRVQEPGADIYNQEMTVAEARAALG